MTIMNNYFYHENNINGKIKNNYKDVGSVLSQFKTENYDTYKENQLAIINYSKNYIERKVEYLNKYYHNFDGYFSRHNVKFTAQSKIRSTILEEFCGYLFKDLKLINKLGLDSFNKKIFTGLNLDSNGNVEFKEKDIDFCIGREIQITFNGKNKKLIIPLIAIECKTWLDKTMLSEAQFTAMKLKNSNPNVYVYIIAGYSGIALNEVPRKSQTSIDQIYLIGNTRKNISPSVFYDFFIDVKKALKSIQLNNLPSNVGKLL